MPARDRFSGPDINPKRAEVDHLSDGVARGVVLFELGDDNPSVSTYLRQTVEVHLGLGDAPPAPAALDRKSFGDAVRQALRVCDRTDLLVSSPLLWSAMVGSVADADRCQALVSLLRRECEGLLSSPRDRDQRRALIHTYFEPLGKQEAVAARLGLSYSTYRRHLAAGLRRLTGALWARELEARRGGSG